VSKTIQAKYWLEEGVKRNKDFNKDDEIRCMNELLKRKE
jgi:hypothetical protein